MTNSFSRPINNANGASSASKSTRPTKMTNEMDEKQQAKQQKQCDVDAIVSRLCALHDRVIRNSEERYEQYFVAKVRLLGCAIRRY